MIAATRVGSPLLLLPLLASAACGGEATEQPRAEIADSAGVRVVVNPPPASGEEPTWAVADAPEVEVGTLEGAPEYQLFQVSDGMVLSDGTLVLANRGTHELRFYDPEGSYLRSAGGQGDGPGEFQSLQLVDRFAGDSLLAYDFQQRRMSVFGQDGTFARSFRIGEGPDMAFPLPAGVLSNGDVAVQEGGAYMAGEATTGTDRAPVRVSLVAADGSVKDSLGEFPGSEAFVLSEGTMMSVRSLTFGRRFLAAAAGERIAVGNNDAYSIRVHGADGSLLHVVRQLRDPVPTGEDDFARFTESALSNIEDPGQRRRGQDMFDRMPRHETFPAYQSIELDRTGRLWIEEYRRPGDEQPVWQVFDPDGLLVGRLHTPPGLRILDIGEDYLLGVVQDDLDVERVRLYRLAVS